MEPDKNADDQRDIEPAAGSALPAPGEAIGQYEIIRELGRGGMGAVYLARDTRLGRRVAVKFLQTTSPQLADRFILEARATARCHHDNIIVIHEVGEHRGNPYMVLEYLRGAPLDTLVVEGRCVPPGRAVELIVPVVRALVCAHEHGIVHRDLKPENVFVVAQLNLGQLIEAYRSFERALRYGPAAVRKDKYDQARDYLKILKKRLGRIAVECAVPGAEITLDGERLFIGPGRREALVSPGRHQLVASKAEHVPDTRQVAVSPGERVRHVLAPRSVDQVARRERRWAGWKPWVAVAAGAGMIAGAGFLDWSSSRGFDRFDQGFEANADCVQYGCQQHELGALAEERASATRQQQAALALYAAGGAALAAGAALIYFNRERLVPRKGASGLTINAVPVPSGAGVGMKFSF
jgi:hypothetical protein